MAYIWTGIELEKSPLTDSVGGLCLVHNQNMEKLMAAIGELGTQVSQLSLGIPPVSQDDLRQIVSEITIVREITNTITNGGSVTYVDGYSATRTDVMGGTEYTLTHPRDTANCLLNMEYEKTPGVWENVVGYVIEKKEQRFIIKVPVPLIFKIRLTIFG